MARGAPHPGQLGFELLHEVPTVGQLGEGVGGGEYLQLGFDLLALGDIGNEAVPQHAAILQPPRACIALAPGRIPLRQLHPVLQVPGRQLAGGDVEGSEVRRQVIRVDDRVQGFRVSRQLLRGKPVDIPNPGTGVGEEGPAVSQAPVLEDHAGNLVGQVGHQCGGLLHLLGHDAHGGNVRGGPDHAQRLAGDIAIDHLAAAADPLVAAVPATQAMFHFVCLGPLLEVGLDGRFHIVQLCRMDPCVTLFDAIADFVFGIAQQRFPTLGVVHLAGGHVAVPDTGAAAVDGQRHAAFGLAQAVQLLPQARVRLLPRQQASRHLGEFTQHMLLRKVQVARLVVQQAQHAEHGTIRRQQRASRQKAHMGRGHHQVVVTEALVDMGIGHHQQRFGSAPGFADAAEPQGIAESQAVAGADLLQVLGTGRHQCGHDPEVLPGQAGQAIESLIVGAWRPERTQRLHLGLRLARTEDGTWR
ncbi:hypothetical protein D9M71_330470 [compost metagenome]